MPLSPAGDQQQVPPVPRPNSQQQASQAQRQGRKREQRRQAQSALVTGALQSVLRRRQGRLAQPPERDQPPPIIPQAQQAQQAPGGLMKKWPRYSNDVLQNEGNTIIPARQELVD